MADFTTYECELCNTVKDAGEFYALEPVAECESCAADGEAYWASIYAGHRAEIASDFDGYDVGDVKHAEYVDRLLAGVDL